MFIERIDIEPKGPGGRALQPGSAKIQAQRYEAARPTR